MVFGASRVESDGGDYYSYNQVPFGTSANPYRPYPGGPVYCSGSTPPCPVGSINLITPPINVFDFDPTDPRYNEPQQGIAHTYFSELGETKTVAYANLKLTAFDRLHLLTGIRWSKYERSEVYDFLCTSIPASGPASPGNCFGRQIGDVYYPNYFSTGIEEPNTRRHQDTEFSWPPSVNLTFDVTKNLNAYIGYTDIYQSQGNYLGHDLKSIAPITGANWEVGAKWQANDGRLNVSVAAFSIDREGFATFDGTYDYNVTQAEFDSGIYYYVVSKNGDRVPNGEVSEYYACCYIANPESTYRSRGVDVELAGEILPGWQVSGSFTYNTTRQVGTSFGSGENLPFVSIQPEQNFKFWTSYDFGAGGRSGWLSGLTVSGGFRGQSAGYRAGSSCKPDFIVVNPTTGSSSCPGRTINGEFVSGTAPYEFTVEPYAVFAARIDYSFSDKWSASLNMENILDKTYYQSVGGGTSSGNWYGAPRSFTATLRGKW